MQAITLTAAGPSQPVRLVLGPWTRLPPAIACAVSEGAALTYDVEVSGDAPDADDQARDGATWFPLDPATTGLAASAEISLGAMVTFIRVNVTSYASGSLTFEVLGVTPPPFVRARGRAGDLFE